MFAKLSKKVALELGVDPDDVRLVMLSGNTDAIEWLRNNMSDLDYTDSDGIPDKIDIDVHIDNRRYAYIPEKEIVFAWL